MLKFFFAHAVCLSLTGLTATALKAEIITVKSHQNFVDSLRTETYKNHRVIVYRIRAKETLYSVARKYSMRPAELSAFNDHPNGLKIGEEIRIPLDSKNAAQSSTTSSSMHTVIKGETLYSISHSAGMKVEDLVKLNSLGDGALKTGQILKVESGTPQTSTTVLSAGSSSAIPATGLYVVQAHETLFAISTRYGLQVSQVKELNQLSNDDIHPGQTLKLRDNAREPVSKTAATIPEQGQHTDTAVSSSPAKVMKKVEHAAVADSSTRLTVAKKPEIIYTPEPVTAEKHIAHEYREDGMGTWLENNDLNQARSVALHHSAPVGTVLKVTNPASRKSIFVKVVGNFQENAANKNAVVIISKSAADLIGAINQNFRVELSYAY